MGGMIQRIGGSRGSGQYQGASFVQFSRGCYPASRIWRVDASALEVICSWGSRCRSIDSELGRVVPRRREVGTVVASIDLRAGEGAPERSAYLVDTPERSRRLVATGWRGAHVFSSECHEAREILADPRARPFQRPRQFGLVLDSSEPEAVGGSYGYGSGESSAKLQPSASILESEEFS